MNDDTTPRSGRSNSSFQSPRDDRFFTPRTIARSNSTSGTSDGGTPRDYQTPRAFLDSDKKQDSGRLSSSYGSKHEIYQQDNITNPSYTAQAKQFYGTSSSSDVTSAPMKAIAPNKYTSNMTRFSNTRRQFIAEEVEESEDNVYSEIIASGIDENDIEEIFSFVRHGRLEEIERLLNKGMPVDVRDSYGNTLLITACQNGNKRVAKSVLRRGADINARNFKGNTPLHYCYHYGYGETLGIYLVEKGADPEARNNAGKATWDGI